MTLYEFGQAQRLSFPGIEGLNVEIKEVSPNRFTEPLFALFATWKNPKDGLRHAASSKCFMQGDDPPWDDLIQRMIAKVNHENHR